MTPITYDNLEAAGYTADETDEGFGYTKFIAIPKDFNPNNEVLFICVSYGDEFGYSDKPFVFLSGYYDTCGDTKDGEGNWLTKTAYQYQPMPGVESMEDLATLERFLTHS